MTLINFGIMKANIYIYFIFKCRTVQAISVILYKDFCIS